MKKLLLSFVLLFSFCGTSFADFDIMYDGSPTKLDVQEEKKDSVSIDKNNTSFDEKTSEKMVIEDDVKYSEYENIMDENYFILYKILDKLLRANNLTYQNWRLVLRAEPDNLNAYSTAVNLIVVYSSIFDSLFDNEDALAFILAHELSHFTLNHAQSGAEKDVQIAKMREMKERARRGYNSNTSYDNTAGALSDLSYMISDISATIAIKQLYKEERKQEFDADSNAVVLMARAGYNLNHAKDALEFLSALPQIYSAYSDHPLTKERITNVNKKIREIDANKLKEEGERNLSNSQALDVKKSSDKKSIIIVKPKEKQL